MYDIGVVPGKFFPAHRGHLYQIIRAATMCKKLYVVVSDNESVTFDKCRKDHLPYVPITERALWLSLELQGVEHVEILTLDETHIPEYPDGSKEWCQLLIDLIPGHIDVIFGGEQEYQDVFMHFFPYEIEYNVFDYSRSRYPVSGTEVRDNYLTHWDYILGSARPFFARRVLITGTESCAKTTLTKYLGKIFHTSWSEEYGRYYAENFLGGNDKLLSIEHFADIAWRQKIQDEQALKSANRICFFDSDAVVTQYYCEVYTRHKNPMVEQFVNPQKYDLVLFMGPTVPWVADGQRFLNADRERMNQKLLYMYLDRGFKDKLIEINDDNYSARLARAIDYADKLVADRMYMSRY